MLPNDEKITKEVKTNDKLTKEEPIRSAVKRYRITSKKGNVRVVTDLVRYKQLNDMTGARIEEL